MADRNEREPIEVYDPNYNDFRNLMSYRIREVLLVSSRYDSYIMVDDGQLGESLDAEFYERNLNYTPRITRVTSGEEALDILDSRPFDLVITRTRIGVMNVLDLAREVKDRFENLPVVLLTDNPAEAIKVKTGSPDNGIDQTFVWRGDVGLIVAIIKYLEDRVNVDRDTKMARVRIILLIENSARFYSSYLPMLYTELLEQTQLLMSDGVNTMQRLRRMKARPKILLAETYEEGMELFQKYRKFILGIISDARFPRGGQSDPEAGMTFARKVSEEEPDLPFLIQSSDESLSNKAEEMKIAFLNKRSPYLLDQLRSFIKFNLGFGDFIFILPDGTEVDRAVDLAAMPRVLARVPVESLSNHGAKNHFSNWCRARTEFGLAALLRPRHVAEFKNIEEMRQYLIDAFSRLQSETRRGVIADFSALELTEWSGFARIGEGSLGGKGRGLGFINSLLSQEDPGNKFPEVRISVPPSAVIGTDTFDEFMKMNDLYGIGLSPATDQTITTAFIRARLPKNVMKALHAFVDTIQMPLAVRSSSLFEDSYNNPLAGIYRTLMLPNNHKNPEVRLRELSRAVKLVYASTFYRNPKSYFQSTPNRMEEEKMAVVVQKLVGRQHDSHFYPDFAGVARSFNYYPIQDVRPEEGIALAALGLGQTVVNGETAIRFSPGNPQRLPQFSKTDDFLDNAQREFYALDMTVAADLSTPADTGALVHLDLSTAEKHGTLHSVGSVYSPDNDAVYDGISRQGIRLVTFAPIIKRGIFPLPGILSYLLDLGSRAMGCPVEIEFAVNLKPEGGGPAEFAFLQIRPMLVDTKAENLDKLLEATDRKMILCSSSQALGHGRSQEIRDVVYVKPDAFDRGRTPAVAQEIEVINNKLLKENLPYLLIGPGRWGSADRWLGIPVEWHQISGARGIVETAMKEIAVEPSQGTHFFQNLTSMGIAYFCVPSHAKDSFVDYDWLARQDACNETSFLRHIRLDRALDIRVDGKSRRGIVLKGRGG